MTALRFWVVTCPLPLHEVEPSSLALADELEFEPLYAVKHVDGDVSVTYLTESCLLYTSDAADE